MALVASVTTSQSLDCSQYPITDATTYGGGEPDRVDVTVDFVVLSKKVSGDVVITPAYDPATVVTIIVDSPDDGIINVVMTIKDATTPFAVLATLDQDFKLLCNIDKCREEKNNAWVKADICGCEDKTEAALLNRIERYHYAAINETNPAKAQEVIERLTALCE